MRRDANDEQWKETRRQVHYLDRETCCCCRVLTSGELKLFMKTHKQYGTYQKLECAHRHPVSTHSDEMYDVNNVFLLCAEHHGRIDHFIDPVNGEPIEEEQHEAWWERIATEAYRNRKRR